MSPVPHTLVSWLVANSASLGRRDRLLISMAGVLPDLDGLGAVAEIATRARSSPVFWWSEYHHVLCHNVGLGLLLAGVALCAATRRWVTTALVLISFHLHLLGDLLGGRGPDGYQWPMPYLLPFSNAGSLAWPGQWALNAWPNVVITIIALAMTLYIAWRWGRSPLDIASRRADSVLVNTLRKRFGVPEGQDVPV
jgi:inner membrane protein